ncbi:hypothetical protein CY34DRAFT_40559, partial [Suillus luteus UH-Slu-Lm8-n1]
EACRCASRHNTSLSENSLAEHRSLKASASVLAVSDRQALETLSRDEKTAFRTLAQEPKTKNCNGDQERLRADKQTQKASLEEKLATLQGDHARSKQEYENQQSEGTRIWYFV